MGEIHRAGSRYLRHPVITADESGAYLPANQEPSRCPVIFGPHQTEEHRTFPRNRGPGLIQANRCYAVTRGVSIPWRERNALDDSFQRQLEKPNIVLHTAEIRAIVSSPEMREVFDKEGVDSVSMTAGEFSAFVRSDIEKWRNVARKLDIVAE